MGRSRREPQLSMSWTRCWKMLPTTTKRRCVLTRLQHQNQSCIKNPCSSIYVYTPGVYIYYFVGESWMQSNCEAAGRHRFAGILIPFLKKGRACVCACVRGNVFVTPITTTFQRSYSDFYIPPTIPLRCRRGRLTELRV